MRPHLVIGTLFLFVCPAPLLAQEGPPAAGGPPVAFPQVTGVPVPLHSVSGLFSSLNPLNQRDCPYKEVSGRVVSPRLILVKEMVCGRPGHDNLLVNVLLSNPADAVQMVTGRRVVVTARFKNAEEDRDDVFVAGFLIAEKAELVTGDPIDGSAPAAQAITSYMMCQPPELDALAIRLGSELCVQSTIVANLPVTAPALEMAARGPAKGSPEDSVHGDPTAISCRLDSGVLDRHLSAIACARNNYWAWYHAKWRDPWSSIPAPP
jgi:hypothetical protein